MVKRIILHETISLIRVVRVVSGSNTKPSEENTAKQFVTAAEVAILCNSLMSEEHQIQ